MNLLVNLQPHDLIKFKTKIDGDRIYEYVVKNVKHAETYDLVGLPGYDFVKVTADGISDSIGQLILVEVFRQDGDVYKKIY